MSPLATSPAAATPTAARAAAPHPGILAELARTARGLPARQAAAPPPATPTPATPVATAPPPRRVGRVAACVVAPDNRPLAHRTATLADGVPVIIENPRRYPFALAERARNWRPATDGEYARWTAHWQAQPDPDRT